MKLRTWLCAAALIPAIGCGDDDGAGSGGGSSSAAAEALSANITFRDGVLRRGDIPESDADTVRLSQDDAVVRLTPGANILMSIDVDNPDEADDPVIATLMQFEKADDHTEVDSGDAGGSSKQVEFDVDQDICDALCNITFRIELTQAAKLLSGKISRKLTRILELDCTDDGDAELCEDDGESPDGGSSGSGGTGGGGTGGGSTGQTTVARELISAIATVNLTACMNCSTDDPTNPVCELAPYPAGDIGCIEDAVIASAALTGPASCLNTEIRTALNACVAPASCTDGCYAGVVAAAHAACDSNAALGTELTDCNFDLAASSTSDTARDAGTP